MSALAEPQLWPGPAQPIHGLAQIAHGQDIQAFHDGGLGRIALGQEHALEAARPRLQR